MYIECGRDIMVLMEDVCFMYFFFFFKQKTAYEIKECDWSSDVCSSDLLLQVVQHGEIRLEARSHGARIGQPEIGGGIDNGDRKSVV